MPTYDYRCAKCGEELEVFQTFAEKPLVKHAGCGGKLAKVLSPAGIVLKGSGFYKTDNRSSSKRSGAGESENGSSKSNENGSSSGSSESSGDSKSSDSAKTESGKSGSEKSGSTKYDGGSSSSNGSASKPAKPAAKSA